MAVERPVLRLMDGYGPKVRDTVLKVAPSTVIGTTESWRVRLDGTRVPEGDDGGPAPEATQKGGEDDGGETKGEERDKMTYQRRRSIRWRCPVRSSRKGR